jgi:hypothetical protein
MGSPSSTASIARCTSSPRQGRHLGFGRDVLYISQPGASGGWLAWDGRVYVWIEGD